MRLLFGVILLFGAGLAGLAVYQANAEISRMQAELADARRSSSTVTLVDVLVTATALRYGQELRRSDVRIAPLPDYAVPQGAYTDLDQLFPNGVTTRVALRAIDPLEPLLQSKLTSPGQTAGITSLLEQGQRAVTISVNQITGVAGFLRPGNHVDIFWTGISDVSGEVTQLIESQVRIIAVNQSADVDRLEQATDVRTVTVQATPEQAAALAQAQNSGNLTLALVGTDDREIAGAISVTQDKLLGIVRDLRPAEPVVAERQTCHIRTRRGNEIGIVEIPCTN